MMDMVFGHPITRQQGFWAGTTSWLAGAVRIGEYSANSLSDVVDQVTALPAGTLIYGLFLLDHGNASHCWVGDEDIGGATLTSYPGYGTMLSKLRSYMSAEGLIHVQNCEAGRHEDMLKALAKFCGVVAYGGTGAHHALFNINTGVYRMAYPSGTVITTDRPRIFGQGG